MMNKVSTCLWFDGQAKEAALPRLLTSPDRVAARRAMQAMLDMVKIDIAGGEAAYHGKMTHPKQVVRS